MSRLANLIRFYALLERHRERVGGSRTLAGSRACSALPNRGVYLFFEPREPRHESGRGPRVVRVGTHGLGVSSRSTLQQRLRQHRGHGSGGGNHRGSIFRLLLGQALLARGGLPHCASWGIKGDAGKAAAALSVGRESMMIAEAEIEKAVTQYIGRMPFLWLDIGDEPGPGSLRGTIERHAIALLSNSGREPLDQSTAEWLGNFSDRPLVRASGLWNQRHVEEAHDPAFLDTMEQMMTQGRPVV